MVLHLRVLPHHVLMLFPFLAMASAALVSAINLAFCQMAPQYLMTRQSTQILAQPGKLPNYEYWQFNDGYLS